MWRRLFPPDDSCPYLKCRAPMEFVEQVEERGLLIDVYRCTGPERHEWSELATAKDQEEPE